MLATIGPVHFVGLTSQVGFKVAYTAALIVGLWLIRRLARFLLRVLTRGREHDQMRFWARQAINLAVAIVFILGFLSIWFDNPAKLATGLGIISAALALALQKAVTSVAGYFLILRGDMFSIGDRILMGGVRGDVIKLGFIKTTIMEMGQPSGDDDQTVASWVDARQHTGRIVTVSNNVVFDQPVFNYSRDFPYIWEEMRIPIKYGDDRRRAEQILLDAANAHTVHTQDVSVEALDRMRRRYFLPGTSRIEPQVYYRLTDNWLELTVRFVTPARGVRRTKSDMSRDILDRFEACGIEIASATYDIVGLPPIRVDQPRPEDRTGI